MMNADKKIKIFVITADQNIQNYITAMLIGEDYEARIYSRASDALNDLIQDTPDLIISDAQFPDSNSVDICKKIKNLATFSHIPLIYILEDSGQLNKAKLIYAGADDYIQKSLLEEELLLRVKLSLLRAFRQQELNPVTGLPGGAALLKELQKRIEAKSPIAVGCVDLYKFRQFNQRYGFKKGDEVIAHTASLILQSLRYAAGPTNFLTHVGGDNFFFISSPLEADSVMNSLIKDFDAGIGSFYDEADRKKGYILLKNRKGDIVQVPLMRVYIGLVTNEHYPFTNPGQIIQIANELKDFAQKTFEKSMFVKERRREYPFS
jgi:PleD family two-component response regulator